MIFELIRLKWISANKNYDIKSYFLPCQHCEHECSIDAKVCPSCGTPSPFGISSTIKLLFSSVLFFLFVTVCAFVFIDPLDEGFIGFGGVMYGATLITSSLILLASNRRELLEHASRVRTQHPEKFHKIWKSD